jgi:tetratricopeptide (TPR) repeat protein
MAPKKISRKQLLNEPDEILTFTRKLFNYCLAHQNQLIIAAGVVIAVILTFSAIKYFSIQSETKAFAKLAEVTRDYQAAATEEPEKAYETVKSGFEEFIKQYGGKDAGKVGRLSFAEICFKAGKYDEAIPLYEAALKDFGSDPFYSNELRSSLAYAYQAKEDYDNATKQFQMIVDAPDAANKAQALFNLGAIYETKGEKEKSREAYNKIIADFSDSIYTRIAKEKVAG